MWLLLLACTAPPPADTRETADTAAPADTDPADTDRADTDPADSADSADTGDTAEPPEEGFTPYALLVHGQFASFEDGTIGTAWTGTRAWPPTVRVQIVGLEYFEGDDAATCTVSLVADEGSHEPTEWAFRDTFLYDGDGDGAAETWTVDRVHHGFVAPPEATVESDCEPELTERVAAQDWGVGAGTLREDVAAALLEAGVDPAGYLGGGVWLEALEAEIGTPYTAVDFGWAFAMEADGTMVHDETGWAVEIDPSTVGDGPLPQGFYQVRAAYGFEVEVLP